jgi:uncharacterized protein YsxB (DUF464 family)
MIKVVIVKEKDDIKKVTISGHAMFDDYGKDIVCSAVSSITTTTVNNILALNKDGLKYNVKEGFVEITNIQGDSSKTLINVMLNMFNELEKDYPKNIKISKED